MKTERHFQDGERLLHRFMANVEVRPDGCWLWRGTLRNKHYGQFKVGETKNLAHRWILEFALERELVAAECALHTCDVQLCVNPDHLFVGTKGDNNRDRAAKHRSAYGERSGRAKHSNELIAKVRAALATGLSQSEAARRYGVEGSYVCRIANGKARIHG